MKVKFLQSPTGYDLAYFPGDVAELEDDELVAKLFKNGIAEATNEPLDSEGDETPPGGDETPPDGEIEDRRAKTKAEKR